MLDKDQILQLSNALSVPNFKIEGPLPWTSSMKCKSDSKHAFGFEDAYVLTRKQKI